MRKVIISILICLVVIGHIVIKCGVRDRKIDDIYFDKNISSLDECITISRELLEIVNDDFHLSGLGIICDNANRPNDLKINLTFVKKSKYIKWKPYIIYYCTVDLKAHEICSIEKMYSEYIVDYPLYIENWQMNLNNAISNDKVNNMLEKYGTDVQITISTTNYSWTYRMNYDPLITFDLNPFARNDNM